MTKKYKIALGIMLAITAILLVVSYALLPTVANDMNNGLQDSNTEDNSEQLGNALGVVFGLLFSLLAGVTWLITALIFVIFLPIVLTSKTEQKMKKRVTVLLVLTVICTLFVIPAMILCWSIATYSILMMAVLIITDLCYIGCFVTQCVTLNKLRKSVAA
ncbi:MAG: hypothetical protein J1G02_00380 [Clostridiales bacterium]|nr:hypothetical protein [Clostridiales bacterium]